MPCIGQLVVAVQEGFQAQDISCFVNGSVQEEDFLTFHAELPRPHPFNVAFPFSSDFFDVGVCASTDEAHQRLYFVAFASFGEGLQRLAVQGAASNGSLAAAFRCNRLVVNAQDGILGVAAQHARCNGGQVRCMLCSEVRVQLAFVAVHGSPGAPDESTESTRPEVAMVHRLQFVVRGQGRVFTKPQCRQLLTTRRVRNAQKKTH